MLKRFAELSPRERLLSMGCAMALLLSGAYWLFYQPITEQSQLLRQKIQSQRQAYQYLQDVSNEVLVLRQQGAAESPAPDAVIRSPMAVIDASSQQMDIKPFIKRLSPESEDRVMLWLENLAFDKLIDWLVLLETQHRLLVLQLDVDKQAGAEGLINAKLLLAVGG